MAIITLDCNLNGGDAVTPNNELFYRIYGNVDNYTDVIHTSGTADADADVTVTDDNVVIVGVDGLTNSSFKISSVDADGNESELSDAKSAEFVISLSGATAMGVLVNGKGVHNASEVHIKIHEWTQGAALKYLLGDNVSSSVNGHFSYKNQYGASTITLAIRDENEAFYLFGLNMSDGLPHTYGTKFINGGTEIEVYSDGVLAGSQVLSNFDFAVAAAGDDYCIGAYNDAGALGVSLLLDSFIIDGENFPCNEGTGTTVTGDLGTVCTFVGSPTWQAK